MSEFRHYRPTLGLRLAVPNRTTTEPARLQQAWHWEEGYEAGVEWRDVPIVVLDDPAPSPTAPASRKGEDHG